MKNITDKQIAYIKVLHEQLNKDYSVEIDTAIRFMDVQQASDFIEKLRQETLDRLDSEADDEFDLSEAFGISDKEIDEHLDPDNLLQGSH